MTKVKRADGSVEKSVQASIVDKEQLKNMPKNTDLTVKRKESKKKSKK